MLKNATSVLELLKVLQSRSKWFYIALIILSFINGTLSFAILTFINSYVAGNTVSFLPSTDWISFCVLLVIAFTISFSFHRYMIRITNEILLEFELSLLRKIRFTSYEGFEKIGFERVLTAISDINRLGTLPGTFMSLISSIIIILFSFVYLVWISPVGALNVALILLSLLVFYLIRNTKIQKDLNVIRDLQDDYYMYLNDLLHGFKEMKMGRDRNKSLFEDFLYKNRIVSKNLSIKTSVEYMVNELIGNYGWYIILGVIMFAIPLYYAISQTELAAFIITTLYIVGPVTMLVTIIPAVTNIKIAFERLNRFNASVEVRTDDLLAQSEEKKMNESIQRETLRNIRFQEVSYHYLDHNNNKLFSLGPVSLEIKKGELIYIIGGNGSGKSTLVKLLTGLYKPSAGKIIFNEQELTEDNYYQYMDHISAIFASPYLFSENYDAFDLKGDEFVKLLDFMKMTDIVRINEDKNTLDHNLSMGQRKRLSMMYSLMENKQILILDEWAAEQDPQFRKYFYESLLPSLQQAGKTILIISHDDAYYQYADRLIRLDYGKITFDKTVEKEPA